MVCAVRGEAGGDLCCLGCLDAHDTAASQLREGVPRLASAHPGVRCGDPGTKGTGTHLFCNWQLLVVFTFKTLIKRQLVHLVMQS